MNSPSDRRRHLRLTRDDPVHVKIMASSVAPELVDVTLRCSTLDVSASGIKLESAVHVPEFSEIEIWVDVSASAQKYFLHGLVKWAAPSAQGGNQFEIGVQLLNMPFTDYLSWVGLFDGLESVSHLMPRE